MDNTIDYLFEWAVWAHLDSKTDLELILLKGHLLTEVALDTILERNNITGYNNYSFYNKIKTIEGINFTDLVKKDFIIKSLREINKMRNQLAHEVDYEIEKGKLGVWSKDIHKNLKGMKFTKYTFRGEIVHSFSILVKNILELKS